MAYVNPTEVSKFEAVTNLGKNESAGDFRVVKEENSALRAELAALRAEKSAGIATKNSEKAGVYAAGAQAAKIGSDKSATSAETSKENSLDSSEKAKEAKNSSEKILKETAKKEEKVAENLKISETLYNQMGVKERMTTNSLRGAQKAQEEAEQAAERAIAALRKEGEPQQIQAIF